MDVLIHLCEEELVKKYTNKNLQAPSPFIIAEVSRNALEYNCY